MWKLWPFLLPVTAFILADWSRFAVTSRLQAPIEQTKKSTIPIIATPCWLHWSTAALIKEIFSECLIWSNFSLPHRKWVQRKKNVVRKEDRLKMGTKIIRDKNLRGGNCHSEKPNFYKSLQGGAKSSRSTWKRVLGQGSLKSKERQFCPELSQGSKFRWRGYPWGGGRPINRFQLLS